MPINAENLFVGEKLNHADIGLLLRDILVNFCIYLGRNWQTGGRSRMSDLVEFSAKSLQCFTAQIV